MSDLDREAVESALEHLLTYVRERIDELSEAELVRSSPAIDFRPPCQLEVFWMHEPFDYQLLFKTHDEDRPDEEAIVNGPFVGPELVPKINEILQEPRWQQTVEPPWETRGQQEELPKRRETIVEPIRKMISGIQKKPFSNTPPMLQGEFLLGTEWHYRINGSITECDIERFVKMGIYNGPSREELEAQENQSVGVTAEADETDSEEHTELTGYGTYIYSPVWIDGRPTRSFQEKVFDVPSMESDLVFEAQFRGRTFRARKDGYLFVEADDAETALRIFNTIFGTAFFFGHSWQAVQRDGLGSVTIRSEPGMQTRTSSRSTSTPRRMLESWSDSPPAELRGELSTEHLREILDASESIYEAEDLREKVIFLLQGFTHHLNNEFSPAFLLTWILIEQHLNDHLDQQLRDEHGVNRKRRKSITEGRNWYISQNIELLEIIDGIDEDTYEELSTFRKKRNAIVHKMDTATETDSEGILNLAARFIVSEFPSEVEIPQRAV